MLRAITFIALIIVYTAAISVIQTNIEPRWLANGATTLVLVTAYFHGRRDCAETFVTEDN